ncbi:hypothetical protein AB0I55_29120 [Actinocatenispora sera]|uniref:hypothetical protein n=1 Tax=Actinocatenispora sera TaxID=390989 RepID=UPI0033EAF10E
MSAIDTRTPTIAVGTGQTVQVYAQGRIVASAVRHGRGWTLMLDGQQHQAATLDGVLTLVGLLPDHHRR